jgi:hypothetical protein
LAPSCALVTASFSAAEADETRRIRARPTMGMSLLTVSSHGKGLKPRAWPGANARAAERLAVPTNRVQRSSAYDSSLVSTQNM